MKEFYTALAYISRMIYEPSHLTVRLIEEEKQNFTYGAGRFQINDRTVRFRVANKTPTKVGQFVAIWEKDENNKNRPYAYDESPDIYVVTTFKNEKEFGQFVFPKEVLLAKGILRTTLTKGKMAIRVYPSWDQPTSKQAKATQKWQLPYFAEMSNAHQVTKKQLIELYSV